MNNTKLSNLNQLITIREFILFGLLVFSGISCFSQKENKQKLDADHIYVPNTNSYIKPPKPFRENSISRSKFQDPKAEWTLGIEDTDISLQTYRESFTKERMQEKLNTILANEERTVCGYPALYQVYEGGMTGDVVYRLIIDVDASRKIVRAKTHSSKREKHEAKILTALNSLYIAKSESIADSMNLIYTVDTDLLAFSKIDEDNDYYYQIINSNSSTPSNVKIVNSSNNVHFNFQTEFDTYLGKYHTEIEKILLDTDPKYRKPARYYIAYNQEKSKALIIGYTHLRIYYLIECSANFSEIESLLQKLNDSIEMKKSVRN